MLVIYQNKMAQGEPWDKDKVIESLKPYFLLGYSVTKACDLAQIPQSTVATWISADESLRLKITAWQGMVSVKARENVVVAIQGNKDRDIAPDVGLSKWWLETKDGDEFKRTTKYEGEVDVNIKKLETLIDELLKEDAEDTEDTETN